MLVVERLRCSPPVVLFWWESMEISVAVFEVGGLAQIDEQRPGKYDRCNLLVRAAVQASVC